LVITENIVKHFILILSFVLPISGLMSQDTVYIDPSLSETRMEAGTFLHPFNSWNDIHLNDTAYMNGKVFLQKCGTVFYSDSVISLEKCSNVVFDSYGKGAKPVVFSSSGSYIFNFRKCRKIVLRNFIIRGDTNDAGVAMPVACIRFFGTFTKNTENDCVIDNCNLSYAVWGARLMYGNRITIKNSEIHNIEDDGIFVENVENVEVAGCKIFDVNRKWFHNGHTEKESPGDCIQLSKKSGNFIIQDNYLNRSGTGNKFCFIHTGEPTYGIVKGNLFVSPDSTGNGGACLFFGKGDSVLIENNRFNGQQQAIYSHGKIYMYYNIFENLPLGINSVSDTAFIFNCVFYNCITAFKGNSVLMNNVFYNCDKIFGTPNSIVQAETNCFWKTGYEGEELGFEVDPQFIDPANGNFRLKGTSPCIDKGTDAGLKADIDGNRVPQGKGVDIGAYEIK